MICTAREITYNNFEISLVVFMTNIMTTNYAITRANIKQRFYNEIIKEQHTWKGR